MRKKEIILILLTLSLSSFQAEEKQVLSSYCGLYGLGSQKLMLYTDQSFYYYYYGCSQSKGIVEGTWQMSKDSLILNNTPTEAPLQRAYLASQSGLEVYGQLELEICL